ncbi:DUF1254 domain-containing protein [Novosphingobium sp. G106]|uniref:DUF1254 domain-containing protein n=1 Tax=Novosphingobium sp. G106 TaxID=2849500 RepID=UPI001C2DC6DB|nr:DUF1254 domain-containing protein [Novosphingobium sp. G106]MBV1689373.1 DUF1254 domain-containing protein [Novosphingobium sp. G106]
MSDRVDATDGRRQLARDAVVWGLPLVLFGRYLDAAVANGVRFNHFYMSSDVATPRSRAIGPNIDTMNGRAWIDLEEEPQVIGVPATADRYYTIQLQDMYMNSFAYVGRRTTGTAAGWFVLTPPGFSGRLPEGVTEVRAPTTKVLAFVRTLVRGSGDLDAVRAINGAFTLGPLSRFPEGQTAATVGAEALDVFQPSSRRTGGALPHIEIARSGAAYFAELDRLTHQFPPLDRDAPNLARLTPLDLGAGEAAHADLAGDVEGAVDLITKSVRSWSENGWLRRSNVAQFIADPLERAANHIYGPGTQVAEESVFYNLRKGPDGETLNGAKTYRLRFGPGELPPVDAFWSLTLYDGNYFLFDNPIDRYGVNDRTEGLRFEDDGSLEILVQPDPPAAGTANWLPGPPGDFQLVFRTYQPRQPVLDGSYRLPPLDIVGGAE